VRQGETRGESDALVRTSGRGGRDVVIECYPEQYDNPVKLGEAPVVSGAGGVVLWWDQLDPDDPGRAGCTIPTDPAAPFRPHCFQVNLTADDLGAMLAQMPASAVPTVLGGLLRDGDPEVIGAVVGRIIAHLAERSGR
jgi:hypothetical protein